VLCNVVLKSLSSASENSFATEGSRLHHFVNEFSLARSATVHVPDQADAP